MDETLDIQHSICMLQEGRKGPLQRDQLMDDESSRIMNGKQLVAFLSK